MVKDNDQRPFPPRTRTIVIPFGATKAPVLGTKYWIPVAGGAFAVAWGGDPLDRQMLAAGLVYLSREDAEAASRAIYGEKE